MLACVDVDYRDDAAIAGCVLFRTWTDDQPADQIVVTLGPAAAYQPGEFYLRELPPILAVLSQVHAQIETLVIDGYVWLNRTRMGLGAHLYSALGGKVAVIGVAKNAWRGQTDEDATNHTERSALAVTRCGSKRPLLHHVGWYRCCIGRQSNSRDAWSFPDADAACGCGSAGAVRGQRELGNVAGWQR